MSRWEKTNKRDLTYSNWHRTIGEQYPTLDIDFIEVRNNEPVALIEAKYYLGKLERWHRQIYVKVALALNIPFYFVKHNLNERTKDNLGEWFFIIEDIINQTPPQTLNTEQYRDFLRAL